MLAVRITGSQLRAGRNCGAFARPTAAGVVLGSCARVQGQIHPADVCNEFDWAEETDDDGNPRAYEQQLGAGA